jgi:hypothetical protein
MRAIACDKNCNDIYGVFTTETSMCCKPSQGKALHSMSFIAIDCFEGMAKGK